MIHIKLTKCLLIGSIIVTIFLLIMLNRIKSVLKINNGYFSTKIATDRGRYLEVARSEVIVNDLSKDYSFDRNIGLGDGQNELSIDRSTLETEIINVSIVRYRKIQRAASWQPLDFIPTISELKAVENRPYIKADIIKPFLELPNVSYSETVVILTLLRDSERYLDDYKTQLRALTYPHGLLSVFFGESDSRDGTVQEAFNVAQELKNVYSFNESGVFLLNLSGGVYGNFKVRHKPGVQFFRRSHIALARNSLLDLALKVSTFDNVLWIDSDIAEVPRDIIEQMLFAKSDVVATPCFQKIGGYKTKYDRNSWQETPESLKEQTLLQTDALVVEGYNKSSRLFLPDLLSKGRIVPLDGVGGCVLMIKADCHRNGLRFPETVYKHHIETEGLAKMAHDMGYTVVGLPFVEVLHSS